MLELLRKLGRHIPVPMRVIPTAHNPNTLAGTHHCICQYRVAHTVGVDINLRNMTAAATNSLRPGYLNGQSPMSSLFKRGAHFSSR